MTCEIGKALFPCFDLYRKNKAQVFTTGLLLLLCFIHAPTPLLQAMQHALYRRLQHNTNYYFLVHGLVISVEG